MRAPIKQNIMKAIKAKGVVILSTGIYARFELIFDWTIDYKSVALPIEL